MMGLYAQIDMIRRQGLAEAERGFVRWAIERATEAFVYGTEPPMQRFDYGLDGQECEIADADVTAALLAPVSFAAVVSDICAQLKITVPPSIERALGDDLPPAA